MEIGDGWSDEVVLSSCGGVCGCEGGGVGG